MGMAARVVPPVLAVVVGVGSGVWIFKPLLQSYAAFAPPSFLSPPEHADDPRAEARSSTNGTFRPEDDHHAAPAPPLPWTSLAPGKTADGKDLLPPPVQDPGAPVERQKEVEGEVGRKV
ncbi:hypothetical protein JCM10213_002634 [Rhodosporidiobolus nylandii]